MKEYNSQGELVNYSRKLIQRIAYKKNLVFIEKDYFVILSGRKAIEAKIFDSWHDALDQANLYDKSYTKKDLDLTFNRLRKN